MALYVGNELFGGDLLVTKGAIKNTVISWFNLYKSTFVCHYNN